MVPKLRLSKTVISSQKKKSVSNGRKLKSGKKKEDVKKWSRAKREKNRNNSWEWGAKNILVKIGALSRGSL